uniref:trinucleotide repeat-containing gene 18 protein-like isoform X2 n=1 Tax=Myxine glutinosa TaxID=7769 RepID=UPI00358ED3EA
MDGRDFGRAHAGGASQMPGSLMPREGGSLAHLAHAHPATLAHHAGSLGYRAGAPMPSPFPADKFYPPPLAMHGAPGGAFLGGSSAFLGSFLGGGLPGAAAGATPCPAIADPPSFRGGHNPLAEYWAAQPEDCLFVFEGLSRLPAGMYSPYLPLVPFEQTGCMNPFLTPYGQSRAHEMTKDGYYVGSLTAQSALHSSHTTGAGRSAQTVGHVAREKDGAGWQKPGRESEKSRRALERTGKVEEGASHSKKELERERQREERKVRPRCVIDLTNEPPDESELRSTVPKSIVLSSIPPSQAKAAISCHETGVKGNVQGKRNEYVEMEKAGRDFFKSEDVAWVHDRSNAAAFQAGKVKGSSCESLPPACLQVTSGSYSIHSTAHGHPACVPGHRVVAPMFVPSVGHVEESRGQTNTAGPIQVASQARDSCDTEQQRECGPDDSTDVEADARPVIEDHWEEEAPNVEIEKLRVSESGGLTDSNRQWEAKAQHCSSHDRTSKSSKERDASERNAQTRSKEASGGPESMGQNCIRLLHADRGLLRPRGSSPIQCRPQADSLTLTSHGGSPSPGSERLNAEVVEWPGPALVTRRSVHPQGSEATSPLSSEVSAMRGLLRYTGSFSRETEARLLGGRRSPFGGLGHLRTIEGGSAAGRRNSNVGERTELARPRSKEPVRGLNQDAEVRCPPVGIAVALARQRESVAFPPGELHRSHSAATGHAGPSRSVPEAPDLERTDDEHMTMGSAHYDRERCKAAHRDGRDLTDLSRLGATHHGSPAGVDIKSSLAGAGRLLSVPPTGQWVPDPAPQAPHMPGHGWLTRACSPSTMWPASPYYGLAHPSLPQGLPAGYPQSLPGAVPVTQKGFQLAHDPQSGHLLFFPAEPPPPHFAEMVDRAHPLWPPVYPGSAAPHPGPPSVHDTRHPSLQQLMNHHQLLQRQHELLLLQQQQALEAQRSLQLQLHDVSAYCCQQEHFASSELRTLETADARHTHIHTRAPKASTKAATATAAAIPRASTAARTLAFSPRHSPPSSPRFPRPPGLHSDSIRSPSPAQPSPAAHPSEPARPPPCFPALSRPPSPQQAADQSGPTGLLVYSARPADTTDLEQQVDTTLFAAPFPEEVVSSPDHPGARLSRESCTSNEVKPEVFAYLPEEAESSRRLIVNPDVASHVKTTAHSLMEPKEIDEKETRQEDHSIVGLELRTEEEPVELNVGLEATVEKEGSNMTKMVKDAVVELSVDEVEIKSGINSQDSLVEQGQVETKTRTRTTFQADFPQTELSKFAGSLGLGMDPDDPMAGLNVLVMVGLGLGRLCMPPNTSNSPSPDSTINRISDLQGLPLLCELALLQESNDCSAVEQEHKPGVLRPGLASLLSVAEEKLAKEAEEQEKRSALTHMRILQAWKAKRKQGSCCFRKEQQACPIRIAMDFLEPGELELRVRLAELQRCYRDKQRELVRLQRHRDWGDEKRRSSSGTRRGPGRPRKRRQSWAIPSSPPGRSHEADTADKRLGGLSEDAESLDEESSRKKGRKNEVRSHQEYGTKQRGERTSALSHKTGRKGMQMNSVATKTEKQRKTKRKGKTKADASPCRMKRQDKLQTNVGHATKAKKKKVRPCAGSAPMKRAATSTAEHAPAAKTAKRRHETKDSKKGGQQSVTPKDRKEALLSPVRSECSVHSHDRGSDSDYGDPERQRGILGIAHCTTQMVRRKTTTSSQTAVGKGTYKRTVGGKRTFTPRSTSAKGTAWPGPRLRSGHFSESGDDEDDDEDSSGEYDERGFEYSDDEEEEDEDEEEENSDVAAYRLGVMSRYSGTLPSSGSGTSMSITASLARTPVQLSLVQLEAKQKAWKKKERERLLGVDFQFSDSDTDVKVKQKTEEIPHSGKTSLAASHKQQRLGSKAMPRPGGRGPRTGKQKDGRMSGGTDATRRDVADTSKVYGGNDVWTSGGLTVSSFLGTTTQSQSKSKPSKAKISKKCKKLTASMQPPRARLPAVLSGTTKYSGKTKTGNVTCRNSRTTQKGPQLRASTGLANLGPSAGSRMFEGAEAGFAFSSAGSFSEEEEDVPLIRLRERALTPDPPRCLLERGDLRDGLRVLVPMEDELLHPGGLRILQPPDVYGVVIDGERGGRPHIYPLEQLLQEAILDNKTPSKQHLPVGARVCAYWNPKCPFLYPGTVVHGSPRPTDNNTVTIDFDDGDVGKIALSDVRLLPAHYSTQCIEVTAPTARSRDGGRGKRVPSNTAKDKSAAVLHDLLGPGAKGKGRGSSNKALGKDNHGKSSAKDVFVSNLLTTRTSKTDACEDDEDAGGEQDDEEEEEERDNQSLAISTLEKPLKSRSKASSFGSQQEMTLEKGMKMKTVNLQIKKKSKASSSVSSGSFSQPVLHTSLSTLPSSSMFSLASFTRAVEGEQPSFTNPFLSCLPNASTIIRPLRRDSGPKNAPGKVAIGKQRLDSDLLIKLDQEGVIFPKTKKTKALMLQEGHKLQSGDVGGPTGSSLEFPSSGSQRDTGLDAEISAKMVRVALPKLPANYSFGKYGEDFARTDTQGFSESDSDSSETSDSEEEDEELIEEEDVEEEDVGNALTVSHPGRTRGNATSYMAHGLLSAPSSSESNSSISESEDSSYSSESDTDSDDGSVPSFLSTTQTPTSSVLHLSHSAESVTVPSPFPEAGPSCPSKTKTRLAKRESIRTQIAGGNREPTKRQRLPSVENRPKISAFLPVRQLWKWSGKPTQRRGVKGKARKLFYKAIERGKETLRVGDCAVFLSAGRPNLPYVGRIESMWESWGSNMVVRVKWFYHPEETCLNRKPNDGKRALYQSEHADENDVQTISHRCQVLSLAQYEQVLRGKRNQSDGDLFYQAGSYDPTTGVLLDNEGIPIHC